LGRRLNLAGEGVHVGKESRRDQRRRLDLLLGAMRRRLVDHLRQAAEQLLESGNRDVIHREGHVCFPGLLCERRRTVARGAGCFTLQKWPHQTKTSCPGLTRASTCRHANIAATEKAKKRGWPGQARP